MCVCVFFFLGGGVSLGFKRLGPGRVLRFGRRALGLFQGFYIGFRAS